MAASLAVLPRVRTEVEKTITYAPDEVCAYRYLAECYLENSLPGKAQFWFNEGIKLEPLLFDRQIAFRIRITYIDSLVETGNVALADQELNQFVSRVERIGGQYIQLPELYLKLGTAYRLKGAVDNAVAVWRQGLTLYESGIYYWDPAIMTMAESLKVYSKTFNEDSLTALLGTESEPPVPDFSTSWINLVSGIALSLITWFFLGAMIVLVTGIAVRQTSNGSLPIFPGFVPKHFIVGFLLFVFLPSLLVPIILALVLKQNPNLLRLCWILSIFGGIIGILLAGLGAVRRARKDNLLIQLAIYSDFLLLWLGVSVLLAIGFLFVAGGLGFYLSFISWL